MIHYATLGDTVYLHFAANDTTGAAADGTSPTFAVRQCGDASSAAPIHTGTPTLLTHATYKDGSYECAITASAGNGFSANNEYAVFSSLTVSSVNPVGFVGKIVLKPVLANMAQLGGNTQSATDLKDFADTGYDPATHKVEEVKVLTGHTVQTGDSYARLGAPVGASISADIAGVQGTATNISYYVSTLMPSTAYFDIYIASLTSAIAGVASDVATVNANINGLQGATITKSSSGVQKFPMRLSSDHYTLATGKTVTAERSFDGGLSFASATGTVAEMGSTGVYNFSYAAADTNGDEVLWRFSATDCDVMLVEFRTST